MYSNNKQIRDVADVAARIMAGLPPLEEKLHPNQQKIDVHEPEKDELTADDFKKLRAGKKPDVKKEEVEQIDELSTSTLKSYISGAQKDRASQSDSKNSGDRGEANYAKKQIVKRTLGIVDAKSRLNKEEVEQMDELSVETMKSAKEKLANKAYDAHMDDNKMAARNLAHRALKVGSKIKFKERSSQMTKEEYTFAEYLNAALEHYNDEEAVNVANEAYNKQDISLFIKESQQPEA